MSAIISCSTDTEEALKKLAVVEELRKLSEDFDRSPIRRAGWLNSLALLSSVGLALMFTSLGQNVIGIFIGLTGVFSFLMGLHNDNSARIKKLVDLITNEIESHSP
jgi:hypothetical protein